MYAYTTSHPSITCAQLLAVDALAVQDRYEPATVLAMLRKAYVAFAAAKQLGVSVVHTAGWGTGANGNAHIVMYLLQALAASMAGVRLNYHTMSDAEEVLIQSELSAIGAARMASSQCSVAEALQQLLLANLNVRGPNWRPAARPPPSAPATPQPALIQPTKGTFTASTAAFDPAPPAKVDWLWRNDDGTYVSYPPGVVTSLEAAYRSVCRQYLHHFGLTCVFAATKDGPRGMQRPGHCC